MSTEHDKWRGLVAPYLVGNGIELATGGDPIVPSSIQFELSAPSYAYYNSNQPLRGVVHWRDDNAIFNLPFRNGVLDYVASSHLLEDFMPDVQFTLLMEWGRVLKRGGKLVICVPDNERWDRAIAAGQPPNCSHRHCFGVGEISKLAPKLGLRMICDKFTESPPGDYNILAIGEKL